MFITHLMNVMSVDKNMVNIFYLSVCVGNCLYYYKKKEEMLYFIVQYNMSV